jgi:hypothetical protein
MGVLGNLIPLVMLFAVVGGAAYIGYQVCFFPALHQSSHANLN